MTSAPENETAAEAALVAGIQTNNRFAKIVLHIAQVALYGLTGRDALYAEVQPLYDQHVAQLKEKGIIASLGATFRTSPEQDKLYAEGRSTAGAVVTNAEGMQSYHNYGLAYDLNLAKEDGSEVLQADWDEMASIAISLGMVDGASFGDDHHTEWHPDFAWQNLEPLLSRVTDAQ